EEGAGRRLTTAGIAPESRARARQPAASTPRGDEMPAASPSSCGGLGACPRNALLRPSILSALLSRPSPARPLVPRACFAGRGTVAQWRPRSSSRLLNGSEPTCGPLVLRWPPRFGLFGLVTRLTQTGS